MSYVRFGKKSDVYIYQDIDFGLRCQVCKLQGGASFETRSRAAMKSHVIDHRHAGHLVPEFVNTMLDAEIAEIGDDAPGNLHIEQDRRASRSRGTER